jgi:poly(A) polymerase
MKFLDLPPGPVVGKALGYLLDLRLDEGPLTEDEAYRRLAAWAAEQGISVAPPGA